MKKFALVGLALLASVSHAYDVTYLNCKVANGTHITFSGKESTWVPPINVPKATLNGFSKLFMFGVVQIHGGRDLLTIELTEMNRPHKYNFEIALEGQVKLNKRHIVEGVIYPDDDSVSVMADMEERRAIHRAAAIKCEYELYESNPGRIHL